MEALRYPPKIHHFHTSCHCDHNSLQRHCGHHHIFSIVFGAAVFIMSRGNTFAPMAIIDGATFSSMPRVCSTMVAGSFKMLRNWSSRWGWGCFTITREQGVNGTSGEWWGDWTDRVIVIYEWWRCSSRGSMTTTRSSGYKRGHWDIDCSSVIHGNWSSRSIIG